MENYSTLRTGQMKPKGDEGKMTGYRLKGIYGAEYYDYDRDLIIDLHKVWRVEAVDDYDEDESFYIRFVFSRDGKNDLYVRLPSRKKRDFVLEEIYRDMRN